MMKHKKANHTNNIDCREYPNCRRSAEHCWYNHERIQQQQQQRPSASSPRGSSQQGFQESSPQQHPPDQLSAMMEMLKSLQQQMSNMNTEVQSLKQK